VKKLVCKILSYICLLAPLAALDTPYIKGHTGVMSRGQVRRSDPVSSSENPEFSLDALMLGYFGGEIDIADMLILRGDFLAGGLFPIELDKKDTAKNFLNDRGTTKLQNGEETAFFQVQELSATFQFHTSSIIHYVSSFLGEFEPIGTDVFLERQFGIQPIGSDLMKSWRGNTGDNINNFYGAGVSYAMRFEQPIAIGFYLYQDFDRFNLTNPQNNFNVDLRFAFAFPYLTLDWDIGLGFPHNSTKGTFETEVLIVHYVTLRTGMTMLIGNASDPFSVFIQGGFAEVAMGFDKYENHDFVEDLVQNLYFIVEPRVKIKDVNLTFSFFNKPATQTTSHVYDMPNMYTGGASGIGADIGVSTDHFHLGNLNFTMGMHATLTDAKNTSLKDIIYDNGKIFAEPRFTLTPYVTVPLFGGSITTAVSVDITKIIAGNDFWGHSLSFWLGFRTEF